MPWTRSILYASMKGPGRRLMYPSNTRTRAGRTLRSELHRFALVAALFELLSACGSGDSGAPCSTCDDAPAKAGRNAGGAADNNSQASGGWFGAQTDASRTLGGTASAGGGAQSIRGGASSAMGGSSSTRGGSVTNGSSTDGTSRGNGGADSSRGGSSGSGASSTVGGSSAARGGASTATLGTTPDTGAGGATNGGGNASTAAAGGANSAPAACASIAGTAAQTVVEAGALLLDVRQPSEFSDGHIVGAINLPLDSLATRMSELDKSRSIVVYCASGSRAGRATTVLCDAGYSVYNLGPMSNWP